MDWNVPTIIPRQPGRRKLWLTADEHYGHRRILQYQNRPFSSVDEMNDHLVEQHNSVVGGEDVVIHVGDFSFGKADDFSRVAGRLKGTHFFMDGSHDISMRDYFSEEQGKIPSSGKLFLLPKLFEFTFQKIKIVLCHYALESWWASYYAGSSVHFHGHSHGRFTHAKQAIDIGVDTNNYLPYKIEDAIGLALAKGGDSVSS